MTETTTDADLQDTQALDAQPVEQPAEAVTTPDSEPTQPEEEEADDAPAEADNADDLSSYLASKGIDLSTPEGQAKLAKSYREAEAALSRKSQEASQLKKSLDQPVHVDSDNQMVQSLAQRVVTMERQKNIDSFTSKVNMTGEQEEAFAQYIVDTNKADLINGGYLSLEEAYKLSGVGDTDPAAFKAEGKKEALQQLANKQTATAPRGNATTTAAPPKADPILEVLQSDD